MHAVLYYITIRLPKMHLEDYVPAHTHPRIAPTDHYKNFDIVIIKDPHHVDRIMQLFSSPHR